MSKGHTDQTRLSKVLSVSKPGESFPFFRLPPELRNQIYSYILHTQTNPAEPHSNNVKYFFDSVPESNRSTNLCANAIVTVPGSALDEQPYRSPTARGTILRASRQTYLEALPICYRLNSFQICGTDQLADFLTAVGPVARANVREIFFCWCATEDAIEAFQLLKACDSLTQLFIRVSGECEPRIVAEEEVERFRDAKAVIELSQIRGLKYLGLLNDSDSGRFEDVGVEDWLQIEMTKPRPIPTS
ncbi:MAG: hypothetical protein M1835_002739 [Candelina submexicana]|nr:MAG: hypothetical protein M1835_002739 [Candelina submexicana]